MLKLLEMRRERNKVVEEAEAILQKGIDEDRKLKPEEDKRYQELKARIDTMKLAEDRYIELHALGEEVRRIEQYQAQRPDPSDGGSTKPVNDLARRDGYPRAIDFFMDIRAFALGGLSAVRNQNLMKRMVDSEQRAILGMSEGVPSDGGFLLYPEHSQELMERIHSQGQIYSRCQKRTIGPNADRLLIDYIDESSRADGSRWGGIRGYWEAEGDSTTATKPKFGREEFKLDKLMAVCYASEEELLDAVQLASKINELVPKELLFKAEDAFFRGDGAGKPQGFLSSSALYSVAKETGQAADTVVTQNILKMWKAGWGRERSVWFYNQELEDQLDTLTLDIGTGGVEMRLFIPNTDGSPGGKIKGRPAIPVEQASGPGDVGDIVLVDPTQYIVGEKGGVQGASSIHVQFLTAQTCFRFIWRLAGHSAWKSTLTPYKRTSSTYVQSPFIALAAR